MLFFITTVVAVSPNNLSVNMYGTIILIIPEVNPPVP